MTEEELLNLIQKSQDLADKFEPEDEEKSIAYDRFAEFLKDYPMHSGLSDDDDEISLWENFKEAEAEVDNYWDVAFPKGDDDDSITDYLTKN